MQLPTHYSYNPKWWRLAFGVIFFSTFAWFSLDIARHPEGYTNIITTIVGLRGMAALFWASTIIFTAIVPFLLFLSVRRLFIEEVLELSQNSLVLPKGILKQRSICIPYSAIESIREVTVSGNVALHFSAMGKKFQIVEARLRDKDTYTAIKDFLCSQVTQNAP